MKNLMQYCEFNLLIKFFYKTLYNIFLPNVYYIFYLLSQTFLFID